MSSIQAEQLLATDGVAHVKFMRSGRIAFAANAKEFALNGIDRQRCIVLLLEHAVERVHQPVARGQTVSGRILVAVRRPKIVQDRRLGLRPDRGGDVATTAAVLNPEIADALIAVREGATVGCLRVSEECRIEIDADADAVGPIDPVLEVVVSDLVAVGIFSSNRFGIAGMEINATDAGNERQNLLEIGAELFRRASLAEIVARYRNAAIRPARGFLEAANIVALPAVQRHRNR